MEIGEQYKPNFNAEDIEVVNEIFGYEFFKQPKKKGAEDLASKENPEMEVAEEEAAKEERESETINSGSETDAEKNGTDWDNFFNETKDIKP